MIGMDILGALLFPTMIQSRALIENGNTVIVQILLRTGTGRTAVCIVIVKEMFSARIGAATIMDAAVGKQAIMGIRRARLGVLRLLS